MNLGGTVRLNRSGWIALVALVCLFLLVQYARSPSTPVVASPDADSVNNDVNAKRLSLSKLLRVAVEAARAGGEAVAAAKGEPSEVHSKGKTNEGVDLPVTAADLNSHCRMTEVIRSAFPKISLVSEEHADTCPSAQRLEPLGREDYPDLPEEYVEANDITVWIDPLDATKEFTGIFTQFFHLYRIEILTIFVFRGKIRICHDYGLCGNKRGTRHRSNSQAVPKRNILDMVVQNEFSKSATHFCKDLFLTI